MTSEIPGSIDDIDAVWLVGATGWSVDSLEAAQIGAGVGVSSALYRLGLDGSGCPATVVAKLPALAEEAVFTSTILEMYIREVRFFERAAADAPVRVPECHHAAVDPETSRFVVVMEDLGGLRAVDQTVGMAAADAERAVDALARWHARWWGQGDEMVEAGVGLSIDHPIYPAVLPPVFDEGWAKVSAAMELAPEITELAKRWTDLLPRMIADLNEGPNAFVHGDFRADNMLFDPAGMPAVLDFQLVGSVAAAYDLAYFVTCSLDAAVARSCERALFDRWRAGLEALGVPGADMAAAERQYRVAALWCLAYPVIASRGMDLDDPRQHALIELMNSRLVRAAHDLNLADLY